MMLIDTGIRLSELTGMTEEQIKDMYEHDLQQFNRDIAYSRHTQPLLPESKMPDEGKNPLLKKFSTSITVMQAPSETTQFWWLDEIEDMTLHKRLKKLSTEELELIDLLAFRGFTQQDISEIQGKSQSSIAQRMQYIRKKIKKLK